MMIFFVIIIGLMDYLCAIMKLCWFSLGEFQSTRLLFCGDQEKATNSMPAKLAVLKLIANETKLEKLSLPQRFPAVTQLDKVIKQMRPNEFWKTHGKFQTDVSSLSHSLNIITSL